MSGQGKQISPSYFWECITLSDDCPFFSMSDPKMYYFGVGLVTIYALFLLTILVDLNFYWTIDSFQQRIGYCINFVKKKLRRVKGDPQRIQSLQERTEKQTKRTKEYTKIVTALRGALLSDNPHQIEALTTHTGFDNYESLQGID